MGFVYPAINQLFAHAARLRNRTRGRLTAPMVVRMPYGGGIHPPEHHSESYESLFLNTPGFKVVVPSTPYDAKGLLVAAIRSDDPVLFMEPKRIYRAFREEVPDEATPCRSARRRCPRGRRRDPGRVGGDGPGVPRCCRGAGAGRDLCRGCRPAHAQPARPRYDHRQRGRKTGRAVVVHEAPTHQRLRRRDRRPRSTSTRCSSCTRRSGGCAVSTSSSRWPSRRKYYLPNRERVSRRSQDAGVLIMAFRGAMACLQVSRRREGIHEGNGRRVAGGRRRHDRRGSGSLKVETDKAVVELPSPKAGVG